MEDLQKLSGEASELCVQSDLAITGSEKRSLFARPIHIVSKVEDVIAAKSALPWFAAVILLAAVGGVFVLVRSEDDPVAALEAKAEPPQPAAQEDTKQVVDQAVAKYLSAEAEKRRALSEQLDALAARVDNLERARAEIMEPKGDAETLRKPHHRRNR